MEYFLIFIILVQHFNTKSSTPKKAMKRREKQRCQKCKGYLSRRDSFMKTNTLTCKSTTHLRQRRRFRIHLVRVVLVRVIDYKCINLSLELLIKYISW